MAVLTEQVNRIDKYRVKSCIKDVLRYLEDFELPIDEVVHHMNIVGYDEVTTRAALDRAIMEKRVGYSANRMVRSLLTH